MTKEEALNILNDLDNRNKPINKYEQNWLWLKRLEALGLLKFDEPKKEVIRLCSYEDNELGMVKVEQWSEGVVLWVGGEIRWKSWEVAHRHQNVKVTLDNMSLNYSVPQVFEGRLVDIKRI